MNYLSELNDKQREAVQILEGPVMVIAGAGSGKTKVLTSRIAHLIYSGIDAFRIMALTFTNKAAREIKERVEKVLQNTESRNVYAGTFHSIFARILRKEGKVLGYTTNFAIYDTDDTKSLLKHAIKVLNLDAKIYKISAVSHRISSAKNALISAELYEQDAMRRTYDKTSNMPQLYTIYKYYTHQCFKNNAMDFDDILLNTHKLFYQFPLVLHKYQHKIAHILIDEFQDTNPLQYAIIKKLSLVHQNICVVGDDAQSIYSFRGATIQNILQFEKDFPDVQIVKLEQNYRSSKNILHLANDLISHNKNQIKKKLWTDNKEGSKIYTHTFKSDNDEARFVANNIMEMGHRHHLQNSDIAILYRNNAQSRSLEESLRKNNIPYIIYGGFSFYQRKEVKDLIAYLRVIVNPQDGEALKRIINYPARGIGQTSLQKYLTFTYENNTSLFEVLDNISHFESKKGHINTIQEFVKMIKYFQAATYEKDAYNVAVLVARYTGIQKELHKDRTPEGIAKYENIEELLNSIQDFISDKESNEQATLSTYLQQIALLTSGDEDKNNTSSSVSLMTIHAAKGLEFQWIYIVGLQEGIFPSRYSMYSREELEEERRLFYVAITRAKEYLYISHSASQYRHGNIEYATASRFLAELNSSYIDQRQVTSKRPNHQQNPSTLNYLHLAKKVAMPSTHQLSANFTPNYDISTFQNGHQIEHTKFGFGIIKELSGEANNPIATILFEHYGEKKIMLKFAKMQIKEKRN